MNRPADHLEWLDTIRAVACLLVILLHSASPLAGSFELSDRWVWANIVDSFSRACVPLFFMISGFLFFRARAPRGRNLGRLLAALTFYSAIYLAVKAASGGNIGLLEVASVATSPAHFHLWFFYPQLAIYLIAIFITIRTSSATALVCACAALLLFNPSLGSLTGIDTSSLRVGGDLLYYLLYAIIGAILGERSLEGEKMPGRAACLTAFLLSSGAIAVMTHLASSAAGSFVGDFYSYRSPLVAISSIALFCLLSKASMPSRLRAPISTVARYSLPIYGLHALPLELIRRSPLMQIENSILLIAATFLLVLAFTLPLAAGLKRMDRRSWVT